MIFVASHRTQKIKASPTLSIAAQTKELLAQGKDIIDLSAGEPDLSTPENVKQAAINAINNNQTYYTNAAGTPELRKAIADKLHQDNKLEYNTKQILVSCGAKHSLYNLSQALLNPNDEVIIPSPYWVSYPDIVNLAGAQEIIVPTTRQSGFKMTAAQLEDAITAKTKLVILNSPSNPTGSCYTRQELNDLAAVLDKNPQIFIASDDIYEHIIFTPEPFVNILNCAPQLYDRTVIINGVSKGYSMTGWRIGYAAGSKALISTMTKIQSQNTSNPSSISQAAALEAIANSQEFTQKIANVFKQRHDFLCNALQQINGCEVFPSAGSFYIFPNFSQIITRLNLENDLELTELLLNKALVSVIPGSVFGSPGNLRLSFTKDVTILKQAVERIKKAIE